MAKPKITAAKRSGAANEVRGEHELTLDGATYVLRPSKAALKAIETALDKTVLRLTQAGNTGDLSITELGIIAAELIRAGATDDLTRNVGAERLEDLIMEAGIPGVTARLSVCLLDAATGGRDAAGNVKAATA